MRRGRSSKVKPRYPEIDLIHRLMRESFDGDFSKTNEWFFTKNPSLENISPNEMIMTGRHRELLNFILDLTHTIYLEEKNDATDSKL